MDQIKNCIKNQVTSEVQNFSILLEAKLKKFKEMEIKIEESNEQISTYSKEISVLKESLKSALDENKVMKETVSQKESTIKLLMKTTYQLQMENYDQENARKVENQEKDVIINALTEEIGSVRKEKESVEEELSYTLEELEDFRSNPSPTTKSLEDTIKKLKERNDELERTKNKEERTTEGSSSSVSETDNANDSIDDLLNSDSEDEDLDRSCSIRQVKVFGRIKGKRSAAEELYSSKMKKGRDGNILELLDFELNKLKTSVRQ